MKTIALTLLLLAATQDDPRAIAELRAIGQPAVDALMQWRAAQTLDDAGERRFETAIDQICRQRDCAWSGLYWYTDFDAAKAAAQREHKPILTLRLLGNLDEELSCANSRFFRTILYSNQEISAYLRANFVLHWKSVRPVPVVKIDFGDGRTMTRTLTGNSIHYAVTADGSVIDALPGMYSPRDFLAQLKELRVLADRDPQTRQAYHAARARALPVKAAVADAWTAAPLAYSKMAVEAPVLNTTWFGKRQRVAPAASRRQAGSSGIDEHSKELIRRKRGTDAGLDDVLRSLTQTLAIDTQENETKFHATIHQWLETSPNLESLNRRVYDELFLTPDSDRWLGLNPRDAYTAIDGDGITTSSVVPADTTGRRPSGAPAQSARSHR